MPHSCAWCLQRALPRHKHKHTVPGLRCPSAPPVKYPTRTCMVTRALHALIPVVPAPCQNGSLLLTDFAVLQTHQVLRGGGRGMGAVSHGTCVSKGRRSAVRTRSTPRTHMHDVHGHHARIMQGPCSLHPHTTPGLRTPPPPPPHGPRPPPPHPHGHRPRGGPAHGQHMRGHHARPPCTACTRGPRTCRPAGPLGPCLKDFAVKTPGSCAWGQGQHGSCQSHACPSWSSWPSWTPGPGTSAILTVLRLSPSASRTSPRQHPRVSHLDPAFTPHAGVGERVQPAEFDPFVSSTGRAGTRSRGAAQEAMCECVAAPARHWSPLLKT
jgi:hypothetical protein